METQINKESKDRLFCFIFGREENKVWTLALYNAVNGTNYTNPDDVEITTMGDYIYMGMKNDVSFIVDSEISLYEHQSSYNPNMPVRLLMYLGRQYDKYIKKTGQNIYGKKQMTLPIPRLVTFYNGIDDVTDRIMNLSDSFPKGKDMKKSDVEVTVHMYNIRPLCRSNILDGCKPMIEYSWFIEKVRENRKSMEIMEAVDKAIEVMPEDYGLRGFLKQHQSEVKNMCITEYNEAETMQLFREEGREEGEERHLIKMICRKLRKGKAPEQIADELEEDEDHVKELCDVAEEFAPDYDEEKVMQAVGVGKLMLI